MKRIKISLVALLLLLTALWLGADTLVPTPFTYFSFRAVFVQYSGVLGIGLMSIAMLLALRPTWLEPHLDGLDKMYRLHKWLGISALVVSVLHWWWAKGTKWMVGWGWLEKPARKPNADETLGAIEGWLRSQRGLAESVGEWVFYVVAVLVVLALVKRFPYHLFVKTHKWLAAAYLTLAYHSAVLTKFDYWTQPVGWVLAALLLSGSVAAVLTLTGRIGSGRKVQGTIASLTDYPALRVLETTVVLDEGWRGHAAGQFAFVTSDKREGAHPYTIASAWNPADRRLTFITKALGDHTSRLRERLKIGMPVTVEGPYGRFDFEDNQPHQIWIGAGIGITPFVAWLEDLARRGEHRPGTRLIYCVARHEDLLFAERLRQLTQACGIQLQLLERDRDPRLDFGQLFQDSRSRCWFCGPLRMRQALARYLSSQRLHYERFEFR